MRLRRLAPLLFLAVLGLATVACGTVSGPKGWSSPTLLNDQTLLVAQKDKLFALEAKTLQEKWRFPGATEKKIKPGALYGTVGVAGESILVPAYNSNVYKVDGSAGTAGQQPFFDTNGALVGGVIVGDDGTAYFGSSDGKLYALDGQTGAEKWHFAAKKEIWSTPVLSGDTLYVTSLDSHLYALDAKTGTERWSYKTAAGLAASPVLDEAAGLVYVGGFDSRLRAIDLSTHQERWQVKASNWFWTRPLLDSGVLYAGSLDKKVYAVTVATGVSAWERPFETKDPVRAAPIMAGNKLIVVDRGGHVYGLTPEDGTMAPASQLDLLSDVLADPLLMPDGTVLVATTGGDVVLIDPGTMTITDQRKL